MKELFKAALISVVMAGERPDYDLDIFSLLVDLVERPSGAPCDLCLYAHIMLGGFSTIFILICYLLFTVKNLRIQYNPGTI